MKIFFAALAFVCLALFPEFYAFLPGFRALLNALFHGANLAWPFAALFLVLLNLRAMQRKAK